MLLRYGLQIVNGIALITLQSPIIIHTITAKLQMRSLKRNGYVTQLRNHLVFAVEDQWSQIYLSVARRKSSWDDKSSSLHLDRALVLLVTVRPRRP